MHVELTNGVRGGVHLAELVRKN